MRPCMKFQLQGGSSGRLTMILTLIALVAVTTTASPATSKMPDKASCADGVVAYLQQAVTQKAAITAQEAKARAELNELRGIEAEEKDGQRPVRSDTRQRLKEAWVAFESATAATRFYDENTLKQHGDLPRACIREMDALRTTGHDTDSYVELVKYVAESTWLHVRLFAATLRGVFKFTLLEYLPLQRTYDGFIASFSDYSKNEYDAIQSYHANRGVDADSNALTETLQLASMYAKVATYALIPKMTLLLTAVLIVAFAPFLLSAVLLPHLVWRVWVQLFILHHTYGMTFDGFLTSLWEYVGFIRNKDWDVLQKRFTVAVLALLTDKGSRTFYNGVFGLMIVLLLLLLLFTLMFTWMQIPSWLLRHDVDEGSGKVIIKLKKGNAKATVDTRTHCGTGNNNNTTGSGKGSTNTSAAVGVAQRSKKVNNSPRESGSSSSNDKAKQRK